ncbi:MAG: helix-turn-helix transcriptional regulator [Candidatus Thermoplasmatota archaeon]|nr:helix-turn-helix transcriptional regulator [Candidatus Thermoplasmatota archaeon]
MNSSLNDEKICLCAFDGIIDIIGRKWAILLISMLGEYGDLRFNQLYRKLEGISPSTLSKTLSELSARGILTRTVNQGKPANVVYGLSERGRDLRDSLVPLLNWMSGQDEFEKMSESCSPKDMISVNKLLL